MLTADEIMTALAEMKFVTAMTMPGRPCLDAGPKLRRRRGTR